MAEGVYTLANAREAFYDASGKKLTAYLTQGTVSWTIEGDKVEEAMERGNHLQDGPPIVVKTGEGNVTGSMSFLLDALPEGNSADSSLMSTWLDGYSAAAAGLVSTVKGGAWAFEMRVSLKHAGKTQTVVFHYLRPTNLKMDPGGDNGKMSVSFDFTDYESKILILPGEQFP